MEPSIRSLRKLQAWNLALLKPSHRRDFFTFQATSGRKMRMLAEERKKCEVDPTLSVLPEIPMQRPASDAERYGQQRISEMNGLIEMPADWYDVVKPLKTDRLATLLLLGAKGTKHLDVEDRVVSLGRRKTAPADKGEVQ